MTAKVSTSLFIVVLLSVGWFFYSKDTDAVAVTVGDIKSSAQPILSTTNSSLEPVEELPKSIYFLGDVMMARDVERRIIALGEVSPFHNIDFKDSSYVVGNFESAIPQVHVPTPNNTFRFSTKADLLPLLTDLGVTHLSLANNHAYDYGLAGYNHTIDSIWDADMVPFGHPSQVASTSVVYLKTQSGEVGVIAIHTLFNEPEDSRLESLIEDMRGKSDWQIAFVHWGDEYIHKSNTEQKQLAAKLAQYGIDLIIGHHPHVVQGITMTNDVLVVPSLGNFIFDQYFSSEVQQGLVVELDMSDNPVLVLHPVSSEKQKIQPVFLEDLAKREFLDSLASTSDEMLRESIINGIIPL